MRRRENGHAQAICIDRQSPLKAMQSGSVDTSDLRRMLNKQVSKTTLLWIPSHQEIAGNEEAGTCAKQAVATNHRTPRPVEFATASALIL